MDTICVCGAGTMGSGIAQLAAQSGFNTLLYDLDQQILGTARQKIDKDFQLQVEKKRIPLSEMEASTRRIFFTDKIGDCVADLVIEAIVERVEPKIALMNRLAEFNSPKTIFATNTSSLSVTRIAEQTRYPERMIGMHFFNPATVMKLLELVTTPFIAKTTISAAWQVATQMKKVPVVCRDAPGFIVNRVARPYYLEALKLVEESGTDFEAVDVLMEASGFKMGPFRLMDLIGNDVNYTVSCSLYEALGQPPRLRPSPLQEQMVLKKELGRKTGKGYYSYGPGGR